MADGRNARMSRTRAHLQKRLRKLGRDQCGAIAVVFALLFPVVAGILGFGVETGIWYTVKSF
jgi:Flp pilus assembly protein TadG